MLYKTDYTSIDLHRHHYLGNDVERIAHNLRRSGIGIHLPRMQHPLLPCAVSELEIISQRVFKDENVKKDEDPQYTFLGNSSYFGLLLLMFQKCLKKLICFCFVSNYQPHFKDIFLFYALHS